MSTPPIQIAVTSVYPPTEAVRAFAALCEPGSGYEFIVVGDTKTPADWACENVRYLSVEDQKASGFKLAALLPWKHYCRKNLAYLEAIRRGAEIIVDTDDDNAPLADWSFPSFDGAGVDGTAENLGFINAYHLFTDQFIWPRGLPLQRILHPDSRVERVAAGGGAPVGVWQGLANGDPDVDAIYRLTNNTPCNFDDRPPVILAKGTLCPFNSQNTAFRKEAFALLYMPALVTFRFTDILRGLIAQPILWHAGYRLGFTKATVVQDRNPHDYVKDFESEIPCYLHVDRTIEVVEASLQTGGTATISDNLFRAYEALHAAKIVEAGELPLLEAWLADVAALTA